MGYSHLYIDFVHLVYVEVLLGSKMAYLSIYDFKFLTEAINLR